LSPMRKFLVESDASSLHLSRSGQGMAPTKRSAREGTPRALSATLATLLAGLCLVTPSFAQNQITIANQPASQGRPISPAGSLVPDSTTGNPAVGSLPVNFLRSPDHGAKDGGGRFLIVVNSGYGIQFSASTNEGEQSLSVIDLNAQPTPKVIQNVYFPSPQSANVGAVFAPQSAGDGSYTLYVSGGYENKIWIFRFNPKSREPISPPSAGPDTKVTAPFMSVAGLATQAGSPRYQHGAEPVYPTGLAISPDGETLFVANNLGDSLGIIENLRYDRRLVRVDLSDGKVGHFVFPYGVVAFAPRDARETQKLYASCWATASVAVKDLVHPDVAVKFIPVERHPTEMILNAARTRLYVANSNADSVSVIDTGRDRVVETISVRLEEKALTGGSPEGLALSADGATLYVANAHNNAIAVVALSPAARGTSAASENDHDRAEKGESRDPDSSPRSTLRGFIPTGQYPSAIVVANGHIIVGNGKGTGFENSSLVVNNSGRAPNGPNDRFPAGRGGHKGMGGEYDVALIAGNYSLISEPDASTLADYTNQVLRNDGLVGSKDVQLFAGKPPIHHIIYIIRENRTYDQVFGDVAQAGNGEHADGDPSLAIFGGGEAAQRTSGPPQTITPNAHALASRFGLLDRFFVNSEASPDGHNWTDAAFSNDYVDKVFRWNYSGRGRTYDFAGEDRLPETEPRKGEPPIIPVPATPEQMAAYIKQFVPYLNGARDVGEPETLYLWDDAARAGISYRTFGEFMGTISQAEADAFNANRERDYPDTSPTAIAFPSKKALENHASPAYRAFDLYTPDSMTVESYRAAKQSGSGDPLISSWNADARFQGYSRMAAFLSEFRGYVDALNKGRGDTQPTFTIMHLPNDHTNGMRPRMPTPQFYVAENDYALGLLVEEVSSSPYWKDTAIFVLEDDAQDGADHVDAHRSPALVISAYNRSGALVHQYHNTVSLVRTIELLLGMPPMNQLDAAASAIDIFQSDADLRPYKAVLPDVALNNLLVQPAADRETARYIRQSEQQNFASEDLANPRILNRIIWYSVRGDSKAYPRIARLPVFDVMRTVTDEESAEQWDLNRLMKTLLARKSGGQGAR
jgi:YVTN family beta-propeller protein